MSEPKKEFGVVGLGKMGANLARQALEMDMKVVGFDIGEVPEDLREMGMVQADSLADFKKHLEPPRAVFVYVPAGPVVDKVLDDLAGALEENDILVDGGNSYWGDSLRRAKKYEAQGLHFVDLGTSGGLDGARHGACFMAGGKKEAMARIEPILIDLAVKEGYVHAGGPGTGHFVKLVHNGIEFGMLQAIAEGVDLLERFDLDIDETNVLKCWRNGSVIRSWLIDLMHEQYVDKGGLESVPPYIEDTGEVNWLIGDAMRMETPVPVIAQAVMQLFASRDSRQNGSRAIAMMRHGFGGHPFGENEAIQKERREGRVGEIYRQMKTTERKT